MTEYFEQETQAGKRLNPKDFVITRKRKRYKFALFHNSPLCFELEGWKNQPQPQVLEVGAGTGLLGVALAEKMLGSQFLAVDTKADRLQTGARMAEEKHLSNVRFLRARMDQLSGLLNPHSLKSIWITFPDPYPKDRSAKHRLIHPHFLAIYKQLLEPGGTLYFKTDAKALFDWSLEKLVAEGWRVEELSFDLHDSTLPEDYKIMTTYEKRFVSEGLKINFVKVTPFDK